MPLYPLRSVSVASDAAGHYHEWLHALDRDLDRPDCDRNELCRRILTEIYYPDLEARAARDPDSLSPTARVALDQMDPRNVTLEPEYYHEIDLERYAPVKPLLWLWEMFDRSPLGENVELGVRFRRILARRIFRSCGRNFKAFNHVRVSYGYNLEVGDNVVIHRHVLLDDRGGIRIGNGASVSDFANVYSHSHDLVDSRVVDTPLTILGDGVRITYHATILAGVHVTDDSMVGAMALATRNTEPSTVHVGIPARPVKRKPEVARPVRGPDPICEPEPGTS
ncbi:acyltransferase [soil metagenome]